MSADLADKLRAPKVTHNVTDTRCPLGSLFIRQNHGFGSFEGFFAGLPPRQPPILTLHVSNGTPITDHLLLCITNYKLNAGVFCIFKIIQKIKFSHNSLQINMPVSQSKSNFVSLKANMADPLI